MSDQPVTRVEYDAWLTEFRLRRRDLLTMLGDHHYPPNRFRVDLHANGRATKAIEDACRVVEALMVLARDAAADVARGTTSPATKPDSPKSDSM